MTPAYVYKEIETKTKPSRRRELRARKIFGEFVSGFADPYPRLSDQIRIHWSRRPVSSYLAWADWNTQRIKVNVICAHLTKEALRELAAHEVAHLLQGEECRRQGDWEAPHGPIWQMYAQHLFGTPIPVGYGRESWACSRPWLPDERTKKK